MKRIRPHLLFIAVLTSCARIPDRESASSSAAYSQMSCGEPAASWHGHTATDLHVDYFEAAAPRPEPAANYRRSVLSGSPDRTLHEFVRGLAIERLADMALAARARNAGIQLGTQSRETLENLERRNLLAAWNLYLYETFRASDDEITSAVKNESRKALDLYQSGEIIRLRVIYRRNHPGEIQSPEALLEDIRLRIIGGDLSPEDAVFQ